eukprot:SAG22_NODE_126_length_18820_cov_10.207788_12_plen_176_part_00
MVGLMSAPQVTSERRALVPKLIDLHAALLLGPLGCTGDAAARLFRRRWRKFLASDWEELWLAQPPAQTAGDRARHAAEPPSCERTSPATPTRKAAATRVLPLVGARDMCASMPGRPSPSGGSAASRKRCSGRRSGEWPTTRRGSAAQAGRRRRRWRYSPPATPLRPRRVPLMYSR